MRAILAHHASGMSYSEIATKEYVSYSSVSALMSQIKRRLEMKTVSGCVLKAHCLGYLTGPDEEGRIYHMLPKGMADVERRGM